MQRQWPMDRPTLKMDTAAVKLPQVLIIRFCDRQRRNFHYPQPHWTECPADVGRHAFVSRNLVFPESSLCAYWGRDIRLKPFFLDAVLLAIDVICVNHFVPTADITFHETIETSVAGACEENICGLLWSLKFSCWSIERYSYCRPPPAKQQAGGSFA